MELWNGEIELRDMEQKGIVKERFGIKMEWRWEGEKGKGRQIKRWNREKERTDEGWGD